MRVVPFDPAHLHSMALQSSQSWMEPMLKNPSYGEFLKSAGACITIMNGDHVVACGGLVNMWENRAQVWSLISHDAGRHFVRVVRVMQSFLDLQDIRRIEATVDADFEQGHRLIHMLGFKYEGLMPAYLPNGRDCCLYGRVK